ncbi:MAG: hypothetical protein JWL81_2626 [Verrucomicrobiales bacterium]|nr:hypothetical protein [Verrucomicrobiales bacterium]
MAWTDERPPPQKSQINLCTKSLRLCCTVPMASTDERTPPKKSNQPMHKVAATLCGPAATLFGPSPKRAPVFPLSAGELECGGHAGARLWNALDPWAESGLGQFHADSHWCHHHPRRRIRRALAALSLRKKLPRRVRIEVIRSPSIGIIGVGEGTTPSFPVGPRGILSLRPKVPCAFSGFPDEKRQMRRRRRLLKAAPAINPSVELGTSGQRWRSSPPPPHCPKRHSRPRPTPCG